MGEGWTGILVNALVDGRDVGEETGSERAGVTGAGVLVSWTLGGTGLAMVCDVADNVFVGGSSVAVRLDTSCALADTVGLKN